LCVVRVCVCLGLCCYSVARVRAVLWMGSMGKLQKIMSRVTSATDEPLSKISEPPPETPSAVEERGYVVTAKLHEGGQGSVFRVVHSSGTTCALKVFSVENRMRDALAECNALRKLDHLNVLQLRDFFRDDVHVYLVFEYCAGGDLYDQLSLRRFSELDVVRIGKQLFSALEYLHACGIAHRDVKPENIGFKEKWALNAAPPEVKLIDFGLAVECKIGKKIPCELSIGTLYYSAPEMLLGSTTEYDPLKADVWSAGVMLYSLLARRFPFEDTTEEGTQEKILHGELNVDFPITVQPHATEVSPVSSTTTNPESVASLNTMSRPDVGHCTPQMKKLLKCLLKKNPDHRPSAQCVHLVLDKLQAQHEKAAAVAATATLETSSSAATASVSSSRPPASSSGSIPTLNGSARVPKTIGSLQKSEKASAASARGGGDSGAASSRSVHEAAAQAGKKDARGGSGSSRAGKERDLFDEIERNSRRPNKDSWRRKSSLASSRGLEALRSSMSFLPARTVSRQGKSKSGSTSDKRGLRKLFAARS